MESVKELNELARTMIGDGQSPDVFFVTVNTDTVLITTDFDVAYNRWHTLSYLCDSNTTVTRLEDRRFGLIASYELIKNEFGRVINKINSDYSDEFRLYIEQGLKTDVL